MDKAYLESESCPGEMTCAEPVLTWKVHLLRENPSKVFLIAPVLLASLLICYAVSHSLLYMAVIAFLFVSALGDYLFTVRYEIHDWGASARTLFSKTLIEWDRVKKYYLDDRGIKLSPLGHQSRLEAYRGVYLRFGDNKEEVIQVVRTMRDGFCRGA